MTSREPTITRHHSDEDCAGGVPKSIAIAGSWGYIGRKFLDAAVALGVDARIYDPGKPPEDVAADGYIRIDDEDEFYRQDVDLFHLALHPEHRRRGIEILLDRAESETIFILNEKPMATPESPTMCRQIVERLDHSRAVMLYDFPELFDSMTAHIIQWLNEFQDVSITHMSVCRSKDREAPQNPRNYKRMVPIQYQESVHCIAFVLYLLKSIAGTQDVLDQGVTLRATAAPYQPPNPDIYPYVVDGRCTYAMTIGEVAVDGRTDFTSGAAWSKRRTIRGVADGRDFVIDVDFLEKKKRLSINGVDQACDPQDDSYQQAIRTAWQWCRAMTDASPTTKGRPVLPDPHFAQQTYQLSSALWRSALTDRPIDFDSCAALAAFDARFADAVAQFPRYGS